MAKSRTDPAAAGERRDAEAQSLLEHRAEQQHRDGQDQGDPEAAAEHLLVAGVIDVVAFLASMIPPWSIVGSVLSFAHAGILTVMLVLHLARPFNRSDLFYLL